MRINLKKIKRIHFVGIKGVAMAALAIIAKQMGIVVSGSDIEESFPTDETLIKHKIRVTIGFHNQNIPQDTDLVIYTGAHQGRDNIEVRSALSRRIPILAHGQALGMFSANKFTIAVAGSHGKTTTSALISYVLVKSGFNPSFAVGCGEIMGLRTSAAFGRSNWFVVEADEYVTDPKFDLKPRFMWLMPSIIIVTNIDYDHPDVYTNINQIQNAFIKFINNQTKLTSLIVNGDDKLTQEIITSLKHKPILVGFRKNSDYQIVDLGENINSSEFSLKHEGNLIGKFVIKIPGLHNIYNASLGIVSLIQIGCPLKLIQKYIYTFSGTKRRFEQIAHKKQILLYDDYAHHPQEIKATLNGARKLYPDRRIIVIFQPHTNSRTQKLLSDFAKSFVQSDVTIITSVYTSAREEKSKINWGRYLFKETGKFQKEVHYLPNLSAVLKYLEKKLQKNDLILTMGAGDIYSWLPYIKNVI